MRRDELFRAEWHLIEIYRFAQLFSAPHGQAADVHARWNALEGYVPVIQNWPELVSAYGWIGANFCERSPTPRWALNIDGVQATAVSSCRWAVIQGMTWKLSWC